MAKDKKVEKLRQQSMFAAMEGLRPRLGPPVPPRKAMSSAKKASKGLLYPLAPYPTASKRDVYRWANEEWKKLGKWQSLTAPIIVISALLTWEKEKALQDAYWDVQEKAEAKQRAAEVYGAFGRKPKRRKFLFIPLPGRK